MGHTEGQQYGARSHGERPQFWWNAEPTHISRKVFEHAERLEQEQSALYERFLGYAKLYDPHDCMGYDVDDEETDGFVADNVVQSAVDTAASIIAKSRPRIAVNTDGGDWSTQRRAKWVERYIELAFKATDFYPKAQEIFLDACVFGTGVLKITPNPGRKSINVERLLIDQILVDPNECRGRAPRHLHQRRIMDREHLIAEYPEHEELICNGNSVDASSGGYWANYRPLEMDQVVVIESWRLPFHGKGGKVFPGRHTICVQNADKPILDEDWEHDTFPFVFYRWASRRITGFHGRGIAEELAGRQRHINRMNWQYDRRQQQISVPRYLVHQADAQMQMKLMDSGTGAIVPWRHSKPEVWHPQAVSDAEWGRLREVVGGGLAQVGISPLSARSQKPAGVESAVAFRELTDTESERFARNIQNWEGIHVDAAKLFIYWAKRMDDQAPEVAWKARSVTKMIKWAKVDLGDQPHSLSLDAAGAMARTPAGRMQRVIELSTSGLIGSDEARRLLDNPDVEKAMSMANAAMEAAEHEIEMVLEGEEDCIPEGYMNVALTAGRFQMAMLDARNKGAPEDVLERMRDYIEYCTDILKPKGQAANSAPPAPMGPPGMMPPPGGQPPMGPPGMPPPMGGGMPSPNAAISPQAMQLGPV